MRVYATEDDLVDGDWVSEPPDNTTALLRSASMLVEQAVSLAVYTTDNVTGLPTNTVHIEAMRDATCAQVAYWITNDVDPSSGGAGVYGVAKSTGIGSGKVEYEVLQSSLEQLGAAATSLCPGAYMILAQVGLVGQPILL